MKACFALIALIQGAVSSDFVTKSHGDDDSSDTSSSHIDDPRLNSRWHFIRDSLRLKSDEVFIYREVEYGPHMKKSLVSTSARHRVDEKVDEEEMQEIEDTVINSASGEEANALESKFAYSTDTSFSARVALA